MKSPKVSRQQLPVPPATLLSRISLQDLQLEMQPVQLAIARRAYELFESRGREHGHDWEDWFRAESELLRPVSVTMSESEDRISVRANVLGFEAHELKIGIEPRRITILGEKDVRAAGTEGEIQPVVLYPDQILQVIELGTEVTPENAVIEFQAGLLKFELPKAVGPKGATAAAA
jgi:HSP20 family protein